MNRLTVSSRFKFVSLFSLVILVFPIVCCTGESGSNNQFLGKFQAIEQKYGKLIEAKNEDAKNSTDMNEAFQLNQEVQQLREERKVKVEEFLKQNPLKGKILPFQPLPGTHYSVDKVEINLASPGNLNLKFSTTINKVVKDKYGSVTRRVTIYFKAVDAAGNEIPNTKTVALNTAMPRKVEVGTKIESYGSWTGSKLAALSDFAKVVEITQEEYKAK